MMFRDDAMIQSRMEIGEGKAEKKRRIGGDRAAVGWGEEPVDEEEKPCSRVEAPRPIESEDGGEGASHPDFSGSGFGRTLTVVVVAVRVVRGRRSAFAPLPLLCPRRLSLSLSLLDPRGSKVPSPGPRERMVHGASGSPHPFTLRARPFQRFRVNPTHAPYPPPPPFIPT